MNLNVLEVNTVIKHIVKDEDAAQNVWVYILENGVDDIEEIRKYAAHHRYSYFNLNHSLDRPLAPEGGRTLGDVIPADPVDELTDGGYTHELVEAMRARGRGLRRNKPRITDTPCPHCGSSQIYSYGEYKGIRRYLCQICRRKFRGGNYPFRKRGQVDHIKYTVSAHPGGCSIRDIQKTLRDKYGHNYSLHTI